MKTAIVNIDKILSGDWRDPVVPGDAIHMENGKLVHVGSVPTDVISNADVVIDAAGTVATPGGGVLRGDAGVHADEERQCHVLSPPQTTVRTNGS